MPTFVGLLLFAFVFGGFIVLFERVVRLPSRASADTTPKHAEVSNVSDTSFTVTWITDKPATGALIVTDHTRKPVVVYDERDTAGKLGKYVTHSVVYRSGTPQKEYAIQILTNGTAVSAPAVAHVRTGPTLTGSAGGLEPAYGRVMNAHDEPATGALVYLTLPESQKLSTLVTASGSWLIPLNLIRSQDLTQLLPTAQRVTEELLVRSGTEETSAVTDTLNDSPVPDMMLGKTYDFRRQQALNTVVDAKSVLGDTAQTPPVSGTVAITQPLDGAALATRVPLFQGTGVAGNPVSITIGIHHPIGGSTSVGADGIWRYTPKEPLSVGKQSVTISSRDGSGKPVAITHMFEILKSGTQVLGAATPSATLTPTLTPTPTSTLGGEPIPVTGSPLPLIVLLILGVGLLAGGVGYSVMVP